MLEESCQSSVLLELLEEHLQLIGKGLVAHAREEPAEARLLLHVMFARTRRGVRSTSPETYVSAVVAIFSVLFTLREHSIE